MHDRCLLVQLASPAGLPSGWLHFDLFSGDKFPPGVKINAAAYQGLVFEGMDRLVAWVEGEILVVAVVHDDPKDWLGNRWARVVRFPPIVPDPNFGGAYNTRADQTLYAEGEPAVDLARFFDVLPFDALPVLEGEELAGQWLADEQFEAHRTARALVNWREWGHGIPEEDLDERGRVPDQRPLGRYDVPKGTRTYFLRSDPQPSTAHSADEENLMIRDSPGPSDQQSTNVGGNPELSFVWSSEAAEPALLSWPAGTYRVQLDVPAVGVDLVFGFLTIGAVSGHIGRIDAALDADLETFAQSEGVLTGAGLHLVTFAANWSSFNTSDRVDAALAAERQTGHGNQQITIRYSADCFLDGPWPGGGAPDPTGVQTEIAELAPPLQTEAADLATSFQTETAEL